MLSTTLVSFRAKRLHPKTVTTCDGRLRLLRIIISLFVIPTVSPTLAAVTLGDPVLIGTGKHAWVATSHDGTIHVVFDGLYRTGETLTELSPSQPITPHAGRSFLNPKIDVDPEGRPHVVYQLGATRHAEACYYVTLKNGSWITPESFAARGEVGPEDGRIMLPDVCADSSGRVLVCAWASANTDHLKRAIYRWRDADGQWGPVLGGLSAFHAASPKVEEKQGHFYLHYAANDFDKILLGPAAFGTVFQPADSSFNSREIRRSFQNEGTNFIVGDNDRIFAVGNFRQTAKGGGVGIWAADNRNGAFTASVIAELPGRPPEGKEEGHHQPAIAIDEATGNVYVAWRRVDDGKAWYQVFHDDTWSPPARLLPSHDGNQGYFRNGPSVADLPGPGVLVCAVNDNEVFLLELDRP